MSAPPSLGDYLAVADSVPGWFPAEDRSTFVRLLSSQSGPGRVLEIGVYKGQSAILLGFFTAGQPLIACDVFDEVTVGEANASENEMSYDGVTRGDFLEQWARFHSSVNLELQVCLSGDLGSRVRARTVRFLHLDGSHLYDVVHDDIALAEALLAQGRHLGDGRLPLAAHPRRRCCRLGSGARRSALAISAHSAKAICDVFAGVFRALAQRAWRSAWARLCADQ